MASEMVLGIGGVRALKALGIDVDVYHFNEGHAIRRHRADTQVDGRRMLV